VRPSCCCVVESCGQASRCARGGPSPPAPSPLVPRGEGENSGALRLVFARGARPLRASTTRPPPPKNPGGGWVGATVLGATTQIQLRPTRPSLPRPLSPAAREKGENSIALRRCGARHLSPTQFVGERPGEGGARRSHQTLPGTPDRPAPPLPRSWGTGRRPSRGTSERPGGGEGLPRSGRGVKPTCPGSLSGAPRSPQPVLPSPRSLWGEAGRGGRPPLAPNPPRHPGPSPTTPPPKLGEGSPAVARNERKARRGRGPPAQRAWGRTCPISEPVVQHDLTARIRTIRPGEAATASRTAAPWRSRASGGRRCCRRGR
jgi:hypothetical protein